MDMLEIFALFSVLSLGLFSTFFDGEKEEEEVTSEGQPDGEVNFTEVGNELEITAENTSGDPVFSDISNGSLQASTDKSNIPALPVATGSVLVGNQSDDTLYGTNGDDVLLGGEGSDHSFGREGQDVLHGGLGSDILHGENGGDAIYGEAGDDTIDGNDCDDRRQCVGRDRRSLVCGDVEHDDAGQSKGWLDLNFEQRSEREPV